MQCTALAIAALLCLALPSFATTDACQAVYVSKCASCHAADGGGDNYLGRHLQAGDIRPAVKTMTDDQLVQLAQEGRGRMPANRKLDAGKLQSLTAYLRALAEGKGSAANCPAPEVAADKLYRVHCASCHGADGAGSGMLGRELNVPNLASAAVQNLSDEQLASAISSGKGTMRGYSNRLSPGQVRELAVYLRQVGKPISVAAAANGSGGAAAVASPSPPLANAERQMTSTSAAGSAAAPRVEAPEPEPPHPSPFPSARSGPGSGSGWGNHPPPKAESASRNQKPETQVRQTYAAKCSSCHARNGSGAGLVGRSLGVPSFSSPGVQGRSDEQLADAIRVGHGKMLAHQKKLTSEQISQLVLLVRQLSQRPVGQ